MSIVPSLLQLKYLDKPCSPPSLPLRLTLATFLILLLHVWHLHRYPVLSSGSWSVSACPVLCLFLSAAAQSTILSCFPATRKFVLPCVLLFCSAVSGVVSFKLLPDLKALEAILTASLITLNLISYLGSAGVFEWSDTPSPVLRLCTPTVAAQA